MSNEEDAVKALAWAGEKQNSHLRVPLTNAAARNDDDSVTSTGSASSRASYYRERRLNSRGLKKGWTPEQVEQEREAREKLDVEAETNHSIQYPPKPPDDATDEEQEAYKVHYNQVRYQRIKRIKEIKKKLKSQPRTTTTSVVAPNTPMRAPRGATVTPVPETPLAHAQMMPNDADDLWLRGHNKRAKCLIFANTMKELTQECFARHDANLQRTVQANKDNLQQTNQANKDVLVEVAKVFQGNVDDTSDDEQKDEDSLFEFMALPSDAPLALKKPSQRPL
uniref:Uncharacterized protein n=1 Tax=Amphora coffeiformis TaxID=265554 RepID=A0A7S3L547_9STRA|eukprot:scaffold1982_cov93-Amphora_coffeaeformis.AAC.20